MKNFSIVFFLLCLFALTSCLLRKNKLTGTVSTQDAAICSTLNQSTCTHGDPTTTHCCLADCTTCCDSYSTSGTTPATCLPKVKKVDNSKVSQTVTVPPPQCTSDTTPKTLATGTSCTSSFSGCCQGDAGNTTCTICCSDQTLSGTVCNPTPK